MEAPAQVLSDSNIVNDIEQNISNLQITKNVVSKITNRIKFLYYFITIILYIVHIYQVTRIQLMSFIYVFMLSLKADKYFIVNLTYLECLYVIPQIFLSQKLFISFGFFLKFLSITTGIYI